MSEVPTIIPGTDDDLVIDGFTEHVGDWRLGGMLANAGRSTVEKECEQDGSPNSCRPADVGEAENIFMYSFGGATGWDETGGWRHENGLRKNLIVGVAIVADLLKLQFSFTPPTVQSVKRSYNIYASLAVPATHAWNEAPIFKIGDPDLKQRLIDHPIANVNCDELFQPAPCVVDFPGRVKIHTTIQNKPEVLDLCLWLAETFG